MRNKKMPRQRQSITPLQRGRRPQVILAAVVVAVVVATAGYVIVRPSHAAATTVPVYRLANYITHERLFSTSAPERDNAITGLPGWVFEGIDFYGVQSSYTGALPVYRLANYITKERLFTTSQAEVNNAVSAYPGWVNEGIAFYSVPSTDAGKVPVYRLANYITHERLFTPSQAEVNNAVANFPGWVNEGIGFYAETPGANDSVYIVPSTRTVSQNTNMTFDIHEESNSDPVNAVQANFSYNTSQFQFVSLSYSTSAFAVQAQSSGSGGSILIGRGISGGSTPLTGDHVVATVTLKAIATGTANITPAAGSAIARSTDNTNVLSLITGGIITIVACCG